MRAFLLVSIIIFLSCNKEKEEVKPDVFKLKGKWESATYKPGLIVLKDVWEFKNDSEYVWTIYDSTAVVYHKSGAYKAMVNYKIRVYDTKFAYTDISYQIIDNNTIIYSRSSLPWIVAYRK